MASLGVSSAGNETGDLGIFDHIYKLIYRTQLNGRWIPGCTRTRRDTSWVSTGRCSKNCGGGLLYYKYQWNCNPWTKSVRNKCGTDGHEEAKASRTIDIGFGHRLTFPLPPCNTHYVSDV